MPTAQIYFDEEEDEKIRILAAKWNLSKQEAVKRILKQYDERRSKDAPIQKN